MSADTPVKIISLVNGKNPALCLMPNPLDVHFFCNFRCKRVFTDETRRIPVSTAPAAIAKTKKITIADKRKIELVQKKYQASAETK